MPVDYEELQLRYEQLQVAIEASELGVWDLDLKTNVLNWDERTRAMFGVSPQAPVDYSVFLKGLHPDDRERVDEVVKNVIQPHSNHEYNIEYRTIGLEDGLLRWVSAKGRTFLNNEGVPVRFIGTVLDITARKKIEEELKSSEERLREALIVASTGTWKIDLLTGVDSRDASLNKMLGLEAKETIVAWGDSINRIHPDDKERMKKALEYAVETRTAYDAECRIFRPDGEMRWIRDRGQVVVNNKGEAEYIIGAAIDITDLKKNEEALKISEEQFRSIFNNAVTGVAVASLNGKLQQVNPAFANITGYAKEELLEMDFLSLTHPDFKTDTIQLVQQTLLGEIPGFVEEKKYIRGNGEEFWGQVSVSVVRDLNEKPKHLVAILLDIHEKKLAEESFKMQARVLESMDEGVSVSDQNGIIIYTNYAEDRMFGYDQGELVGQHVSVQNAYDESENLRIVTEVIEELKEHGYWNGEWHNKRKDGSTFYTFSHITLLDLGERRVMVCVQRDITEEKLYKEMLQRSAEELEHRVEDRTRELKAANEALEQSNAELEQFAYITSHDLQEPLRKIMTFTYRIEEVLASNADPNIQKYISKVINSANRMSVLIRDLLNYSRMGTENPQMQEVDLAQVLQEVKEDLEILIQQKGAVIEAEPLPVISGIPLQLSQLFYNLINNGIKFSKEGVVPIIQIRSRKLSSKESILGRDGFEISFQDNGIGFDTKYKDRIFEIFQRLNNRDVYAGTGIGLAISKRVVQNHSGIIEVDSREGEGSTFRVLLPL